ncbi:MAG: GNAT family N-acetyltransferase, partial [Chloroflexi bacterium]|nr:GNAT family N-acetyltransferase [Chloroflexota bacterium]
VQLAVFDERSGPYRRKRRHAAIGDVVVTSEHRHAGVGRLLMAAASDWAQAKGAAEIERTVWDFNRDATALYKSLGYHTTKRMMLRPLE